MHQVRVIYACAPSSRVTDFCPAVLPQYAQAQIGATLRVLNSTGRGLPHAVFSVFLFRWDLTSSHLPDTDFVLRCHRDLLITHRWDTTIGLGARDCRRVQS